MTLKGLDQQSRENLMKETLSKCLTYLGLKRDLSNLKGQPTKTLTTTMWLGKDGDLREILILWCQLIQWWTPQRLMFTRHACKDSQEWPILPMDGFRVHSLWLLLTREPLARDASILLILLELKLAQRLRDLSLGWNEEMCDRLTKLMISKIVDLTQSKEHPLPREI